MKRLFFRLEGAIAIALLLSGTVSAGTVDTPSTLVQETTTRMLDALAVHRTELYASPQLIYELVNDIVVPAFDFERTTRFAMGRSWRRASEAQRTALVAEFQRLLVRTYAKAFLSYTGQKIATLPPRETDRDSQVVIRTTVSEPGGPPVLIEYRMYLKGTAWKVYDVSIDGISLVANYRSSFAAEIRRGGIGGLIEALKTRNGNTQDTRP